MRRILLISGLAWLPTTASAQDTVRFTPTVGYPTFAVREPVLTVRPGTVLVSNTNFGAYYTEEGGAFPGEVGPIYVEGATTNDMLVVKVHAVDVGFEEFEQSRRQFPCIELRDESICIGE